MYNLRRKTTNINKLSGIKLNTLVIGICLLLFNNDTLAQLAGYSFKKRITIDNTQVVGTADHTDFPILVSFIDADLRTIGNGGNVTDANGYDIVFTASDGTTLLDHQIEKYVATTGEYIAWVRFPTLDYNNDMDIFIYYRNSLVSTDQSTAGVWDVNFGGIWHLNDAIGANNIDATANNNNGTPQDLHPAATAGKIGDALDFNVGAGNKSGIEIPHHSSLEVVGVDNWTMSAWVRPTLYDELVGKWPMVYAYERRATIGLMVASALSPSDFGRTEHWTNNLIISDSDNAVNFNVWNHIVIVRNPANTTFYLNGSANGSLSSVPITISPQNITIGSTVGRDNQLHGLIDEVRYSSTNRSADWIATEFNNQDSPSTFYNVGAEEAAVPTVAFNSASSSGLESVATANLAVDISAASGLDVSVDYIVTGTAIGSGTDYTLANGSLTISVGDADNSENITIASIVDDLLDENDETVVVTLSNPTNATLGANTVHTYTITDNDVSITNISSFNTDGIYGPSNDIFIAIVFTKIVNVIGTPQILLETGTTDRYANYSSGDGSTILIFLYTVQLNDISYDLDYTATNALELNGGTIRSGSGGDADLTLPNPGTLNSLGDAKDIQIDGVNPTVEITQALGQVDPTSRSPINFTATFSEDVTGFDIATDVTISGTANATTVAITGGPGVYNLAVSGMTGDGTVIVSIAGAVCTDLAGNDNTASVNIHNQITYDKNPTIEITQAVGQADPTNLSPINFTVTFSSHPNGGIIGLSGTAGATTSVVSGGPLVYNLAISGMTDDGTVILNFSENVNTTYINTDNQVTYDGENPTVEITQALGQVDPTNSSPINFTATFSETVTGFTDADVSLSGTAGATTVLVTGSTDVYNIAVSGMTGEGTVIVDIASGVCTDLVGNNNLASTNTDNQVIYDGENPAVEITQATGQTDPTNSSPINFTATFSETVTGFTDADVSLSGIAGATTVLVTGSTDVYNIAVSGMTGNGTVIISIAGAVCTDLVGNDNSASTNTDNTVTYDTGNPTVEITQALGQVDPTNSSPINFTATFSETVTGFTDADVSLSGTAGATTVLVTGSTDVYNIAVSGMTGNGTVIISIAGGVCTDIIGNSNLASINTDNEVIYDGIKPSIIISSSESGTTELTDIPISILFSELVQGFSPGDIKVANGSISGFTQDVQDKQWSAFINPLAPGVINVSISADVTTDFSNNGNLSSNIFSIEYIVVNHPPVAQNQEFSINEDSELGTIIGTVVASDQNNDNMSFEIVSGNVDDVFRIDYIKGELSLASSGILNYETNPAYELTVQIEDDGSSPESTQCTVTINVVEVEDPFEANNIFTPNDDRNKYWLIQNVQDYNDFELVIRSATGQLVYKTLNYQNDWNGTFNNQALPTGTYYFSLVSSINGKSYSGFINLIRN